MRIRALLRGYAEIGMALPRGQCHNGYPCPLAVDAIEIWPSGCGRSRYCRLAPRITRPLRGSQIRLGKCSREFLFDLLKPAGLKEDLRLRVADDIASKLLSFYDQTRIADAGRDVLICHVASNERTTFALCDQIFQFDPTSILNEIASFHHILGSQWEAVVGAREMKSFSRCSTFCAPKPCGRAANALRLARVSKREVKAFRGFCGALAS